MAGKRKLAVEICSGKRKLAGKPKQTDSWTEGATRCSLEKESDGATSVFAGQRSAVEAGGLEAKARAETTGEANWRRLVTQRGRGASVGRVDNLGFWSLRLCARV